VNVRTGASTRIPGYSHDLARPDSLTLRYEEWILGGQVGVLNDFAGVEPENNFSTKHRVFPDADNLSGAYGRERGPLFDGEVRAPMILILPHQDSTPERRRDLKIAKRIVFVNRVTGDSREKRV
jgi:hypothetical protein